MPFRRLSNAIIPSDRNLIIAFLLSVILLSLKKKGDFLLSEEISGQLILSQLKRSARIWFAVIFL